MSDLWANLTVAQGIALAVAAWAVLTVVGWLLDWHRTRDVDVAQIVERLDDVHELLDDRLPTSSELDDQTSDRQSGLDVLRDLRTSVDEVLHELRPVGTLAGSRDSQDSR